MLPPCAGGGGGAASEAPGWAEARSLYPLPFGPLSLLRLLSCGREACAASSISSSVMTVIRAANPSLAGRAVLLVPLAIPVLRFTRLLCHVQVRGELCCWLFPVGGSGRFPGSSNLPGTSCSAVQLHKQTRELRDSRSGGRGLPPVTVSRPGPALGSGLPDGFSIILKKVI